MAVCYTKHTHFFSENMTFHCVSVTLRNIYLIHETVSLKYDLRVLFNNNTQLLPNSVTELLCYSCNI